MQNRRVGLFIGCLIMVFGSQAGLSQSLSDDYVNIGNEQLADEDFFKAVTCGAPVGGPCEGPAAKWPKRAASDLTIKIVTTSDAIKNSGRIRKAVEKAVAELNSVTSGLNLSILDEDDKRKPKIRLLISDLQMGDTITGSGSDLDGSQIEAAAFNVEWDSQHRITKATIVLTQNLPNADLPSIVLEEIAQTLGPIYDIRGKYYNTRSIFSQDGNSVTKLGPQDRYVLKRLYGKN